MITLSEAKSLAKSIYLQSASMSGFDVSERSPTALSNLVEEAYSKFPNIRRPEAVSNLLRLIAATLEEAQRSGDSRLGENSINKGREKICPVYPFD